MRNQIDPTIKTHLLQSAFIVLPLLAVRNAVVFFRYNICLPLAFVSALTQRHDYAKMPSLEQSHC